jgi:RNA polymerase sigma-70 factor (ECF subfamily)
LEPRGRARFDTTQWSLILAAGDSRHPGSRDALETLCGTYWYPVYAFIRRKGNNADAAVDLTQGFFTQLLEKNYLKVVRKELGRFRSFLLTAVQHYLANEWDRARAQKRGGGRAPIPLDRDTAEGRYRIEPAERETPEELYERRWAFCLLHQVLEQLKEEGQRTRHPERVEALIPYLTGEQEEVRYRELAATFGIKEGAVKVAIHRLRKRFGELLREEIARTVERPEQVEKEIRHLFSILSPSS